jgi:hypothetical protein
MIVTSGAVTVTFFLYIARLLVSFVICILLGLHA